MASTTGAQTKAAVSAIPYLDRREILKDLVDIQNEEGLIDVLGMGGKREAVTQPIFHDFADDPIFILLDTAGATVTGSGTATVTTTFTAPTSGYARKGLKVLFPNGKVGQIQTLTTSAGQDTVTIKSVDNTNLTHTAGQKLSPQVVMVGEKSAAPQSLKHGMTRYYNLIQHQRETYESTDVQIQSDIELTIDGSNYIWNRDIANAMLRFKGAMNADMISSRISIAKFEDASSTLLDPINGGNQQSQRGLNQYVTDYGVNDDITTYGTFVLADFEDFFNLLTAARAPQKYIGYASNAAMMKFSIWAKGQNSSGVLSGKLSLDGKEIDLNAEKLTFGKYSLQVASLPILDHPVLVSQTDIPKSIFWCPEGKVSTRGGKLLDRMTLMYQKEVVSNSLGNDQWSEWDTGALARGGAVGEEMSRKTHFHSAQALRILAPQHFGKQRVLA